MTTFDRIYLDNAATSFPKPEAVYAAVDHYNRKIGAAVGRSAYRTAVEAEHVVARCRKRAAELFGVREPNRVVFTSNGTDSLNLAIHGLLNAGDHVVTTVVEHNSMLRPLYELAARRNVEVTYVDSDAEGRVDPARIREAIRPNTRLVACIHASNVTGTIQPIHDIGEVARQAGAVFLVDAAQSAGHLPIDLADTPIDLLACPGHKGLLGPLGTGLLYVGPGMEARLASVRQGGTGSHSEDERQHASLPDKYESGNHNAPGLFGLDAALGFLLEQTPAAIHAHEAELTARLVDRLSAIDRVTVYGPRLHAERVGVVSINLEGFEPQVLAGILDDSFHIETRAGLHCAPRIHRRIGSFDLGGTVRFSVGPFTTLAEIDAAVNAVKEIAASA